MITAITPEVMALVARVIAYRYLLVHLVVLSENFIIKQLYTGT